MRYIDDKDVWPNCPVDCLWVYDKLILAAKCGHKAGPAGVPVPEAAQYIIRPITNIRMMGRGAVKRWLTPDDTDLVPDGHFWSEVFTGRHISVDFHNGIQTLAVEGFRGADGRLDRFTRWQRIECDYSFPLELATLRDQTPWVNVEYVGGKIIEAHLRWNDDFRNHSGTVIYPVWADKPLPQPRNTSWYPSPSGDRLGFWVSTQ